MNYPIFPGLRPSAIVIIDTFDFERGRGKRLIANHCFSLRFCVVNFGFLVTFQLPRRGALDKTGKAAMHLDVTWGEGLDKDPERLCIFISTVFILDNVGEGVFHKR